MAIVGCSSILTRLAVQSLQATDVGLSVGERAGRQIPQGSYQLNRDACRWEETRTVLQDPLPLRGHTSPSPSGSGGVGDGQARRNGIPLLQL